VIGLLNVQYAVKDGTVFDKTAEGETLEFTVGEGKILPDLEQAVEGMNIDDQKTVDIVSDRAYGRRDESLIRQFDRKNVPQGFVPQPGLVVELQLPSGEMLPATITDVTDQSVVVDLNHPLAGKDLKFDIKVVGIAVPETK
jgi:peptidylprolyl isomerase